MKRRRFLQTLGAVAPAALVEQSGEAAAGEAAAASVPVARKKRSDEPRAFMFDDGRHAAALYQFEPPLTPEDLTFTVDQLAGSGIDTLIYFAGLEGGVALYDSRVAQKWGDNVTKWTHTVWYRAARHVQQLVREGHDPLKLICDRCQEQGIWLIASNYVTLTGGDRATFGGQGRKSDFVYDNPKFQVGPENDPRAKKIDPKRFSFLHAEFQQERFRVFEELLSRYEVDGVELNLAEFAPFCKFSEANLLVPVLTQWIRELRGVARKAEATQGRRKRLYVRIPASPELWKVLGYDVPTWVSDKLVDGLVCLPGLMESPMDQDPGLSAAVRVTRGTGCRVLSAFEETLGRAERYATQPMIWAAAANAFDQGADGFGIAAYCWFPNGWPWSATEYQTQRLFGQPEILATADKIYRARSARSGQQPADDWFPGVPALLPRELVEGKPIKVHLQIADNLAHWNAQGKVESVQLRVRLTSLEASLNEVRIEFNGRPLPDSIRQLSDLTYRLLKHGTGGPYGYIYQYDLPPEYFPKRGANTLAVTLVKKDPNIDMTIQVFDVDCSIKYLVHRNFQRDPVDY